MKIGIITMHKVLNFGSTLQAYALQRKIELLGFNSEIIDYVPNRQSDNICSIHSIKNKFICFLKDAILGFPHKIQNKRFNTFYQKHFVCSNKEYNKLNINCNHMDYDIYCTGSDQVWNPRFINDDTNYLLSFVPTSFPRFSYASSFATSQISDNVQLYQKYLAQYNSITVREQTGVNLVNQLVNTTAQIACDPTILLDEEEWCSIIKESKCIEKREYILVYLLGYMFNMRPQVYSIIDKIQTELGLRVIYLNGSKYEVGRPNSKLIKNCGPAEFLYLIKNANFVITDSFHGTAFSCIFNRPFIGVIRDNDINDNRISSLVKLVGNEKSLVCYDTIPSFSKNTIDEYKCNIVKLRDFRKKSSDLLKNMILECEAHTLQSTNM